MMQSKTIGIEGTKGTEGMTRTMILIAASLSSLLSFKSLPPHLILSSLAPHSLPHHEVVSPFGRGNAQFVINIYPLGRNDLELSKILAKFVV